MFAWPRAISRENLDLAVGEACRVRDAGGGPRLACGDEDCVHLGAPEAARVDLGDQPLGGVRRGRLRSVRAALGHRVIRIGSREHARAEREPVARDASVVARAVGALVVAPGEVCEGGEERGAGEDALAEVAVEAYPLPLLGGERAGVVPDPARDADAADVVHEPRPTDRHDLVRRHARRLGGRGREPGDAGRVRAEEPRLQVGEVGHGGERVVEAGVSDGQDGCGLGVEDGRPRVVAELGEPLRPALQERIDHLRVVRVPAPVGEHVGRGAPAFATRPELDVPGDGDDADRDGDVRPREPARQALSVPALVRVLEPVADRRVHAEAGGEPGADLTVPGQAAPLEAGIEHRTGDPSGPPMWWEVLCEVAHEVARARRAPSHQHRAHLPVQRDVVAARERRGLRRIRRAADEPQERDVVHARTACPVEPELPRRGTRQPARSQAVLHRLARSEVRRERQCDRELGQSSRAGLRSHADTLPSVVLRTRTTESSDSLRRRRRGGEAWRSASST